LPDTTTRTAAARAALRASPGEVGRVELAGEFGCLVWSVEIERGDALPVVVLVDAGSGAVSSIERGRSAIPGLGG